MADKSKDTGTGGINIAGKVQTMDVGVPDSEAAAQTPVDYSSGDITVDKSVKDISKPVRETFAKYLSKSTLGIVGSSPHKNVYPVGSGEGTQVDQLKLKDANGNPTSPGSQNNENKFATGFNSTIASNNPAGIKRGLASGDAPDGNTLLSGASTPARAGTDFIKFVSSTDTTGLKDPIKKYTRNLLESNLNDPFGSKSTDVVGINKTTDLETDGGTSKAVLDSTKTMPFEVESELVRTLTVENYYPVDSPVDGQTLAFNLFKLNVANGLAATNNNAAFANINIGVGASIFSKGKLTIIDPQNSSKKLPNGNELLPGATEPGEAGHYVKLSGPLNDPIKSYVTDLFARNIRPIGEVDIYKRGELFDQYFFGPINLHIAQAEDIGTFDNIIADPSKRRLTRNEALAKLKREVAGEDGLGGIPNNFTPFDTKKVEDYQVANDENFDSDYSLTNNGFPRSPMVEQGVIDESATWKFEPNLTNVSSYSAEALTILGTNIRRGKSDFVGPDGNDLLRRAAPVVTNQAQFIKLTNLTDDTPVAKYVGAVLEKNRYNAGSRFVNTNTPGAVIGSSGEQGQSFENISDDVSASDRPNSFLERTKLYSPRSLKLGESPQSTIRRGEQVQGYTFRRLTRIGTILQLRAAGELTFLAQDDADPRSNTQQLAALLPGAGQLLPGVPFSRELLNVTEIVKFLPDDDISGLFNSAAKYEGELIDIGRSFEGTVNTTLEKFSGFSAIGLIVLSIVMVAVILAAVNALFGGLIENDSLNKSKDRPGGKAWTDENQLRMGVFQEAQIGGGGNIVTDIMAAAMDKSAAIRLFGIMPTYNVDYSDALMRGSFAFFGLGADPPQLLAFPGQVIVTSRAIIRGVAQLVKALADLALTFAAGSITSAIFKLLDIIEVIKNSRVIKAVNTFSQLGDRTVYTINEGDYSTDWEPEPGQKENTSNVSAPGGNSSNLGSMILGDVKEKYQRTKPNDRTQFGKKFSEIDSIVNANKHAFVNEDGDLNAKYVGISHAKNRLQNSRALAWSSYRSPSLLLDPTNVPLSIALTPESSNARSAGVPNISSTDVADRQFIRENGTNSPRIDADTVAKFEEAIDGEYMPFYFHDLRTNEIIGFHAFLLSLSDDYTANYESSPGIGRLEPIRTYKDTQRKIGLSFMLPALDKNDFNHMWEKINKLTMLVYPQFTRGKQYKNETAGITFDKPFTQMVGAAPMIRLRLGNLLRSNYSKFNIAGIFGLTSGEAVLPDSSQSPNTVVKLVIDKAQHEVIKKFKADKRNKYKVDRLYKLNKGEIYRTQIDKATSARLGLPSSSPTPAAAATPQPAAEPEEGIRYKEKGDWYRTFESDSSSVLRFKIKKILPEDAVQVPEYAVGIFTVEKKANEKERSTMVSPAGKEYYVPIKDIEMDSDTQKAYETDMQLEVEKQTGKIAAARGAVNEFLDPKKNAIIRSFESTKGKGLAGFIDSLSFDWYDRTTWDMAESRKAPKMCKITISFTPVHDITPGLDAAGNNRAPIYQLGPYATELVRG